MASGIRGITVEINGNTKKLNDALKETGKETKDIKAELAQSVPVPGRVYFQRPPGGGVLLRMAEEKGGRTDER